MKKRVVAVIPARMASSRFPGKPLARLLDLPMVEHVRRRAALADGIDEVVVATCDDAIMDAVRAAGGLAIMTADTHERCTDRVHEASAGIDADVIAIVQGDEPLLIPEAVRQVTAPLLVDDGPRCVNLLSPLESDADFGNPNIVKAVCDLQGRVMFLSRAPLPHFRKRVECPVYRQTGIMAFTRDLLNTYAQLPETPFEKAEAVDMLRLLEHGIPILGVVVDYVTVGVDRPEDVPTVEDLLRTDPTQRKLYERTRGV